MNVTPLMMAKNDSKHDDLLKAVKVKVKISLLQAMEAQRP
jgi:hypothetical protein